MFTNTDGNSRSDLITGLESIGREVPFSLTYADTAQNWFVGYTTGSVAMDAAAVGSDWGSGEELPVSVTDQDLNRNSLVQEHLVVTRGLDDLLRQTDDLGDNSILSVQLGSDGRFVLPYAPTTVHRTAFSGGVGGVTAAAVKDNGFSTITFNARINSDYLTSPVVSGNVLDDTANKRLYLEWDVTSLGPDTKFRIWAGGGDYLSGTPLGAKGFLRIDDHSSRTATTDFSGNINFHFVDATATSGPAEVMFAFHVVDSSDQPSVATLEETGTNTGVFDGTIEYVMLNQLSTDDQGMPNDEAPTETFLTEDTILVLDGDYLDEDGIRIDYIDIDEQGQMTVASARTDAPTHSGSVSLDQDNYKQADTVKITLEDADLNLNNELRDVYTAITDLATHNRDTISRVGNYATSADDGLMLEATFDDTRWISCDGGQAGFGTLISSIRETAPTSGIFVADFQVPREYCTPILNDAGTQITGASVASTTLGKDLEVTYYDYFDSAGERNEVGDVAGITSFTGSVSLDRSVYPVPFAPLDANDRAASDSTPAKFRYHESFKDSNAAADTASRYIDDLGDVMIHVQINDKDLDQSGSGTDRITNAAEVLTVEISRDNIKIPPASATETALTGKEIRETSPTSGIFELDLPITWQDGPWQGCPTGTGAFDGGSPNADPVVPGDRCLLQGDILTVTYTDASDATGNENTVTDSATFDLRNGVLQSDKSVYIIGSDMILTLIDPDLDLDNDGKQSYSLDIIEWDSDAATLTMGDGGGQAAVFDPEPAKLQETGDSTGIFQSIVEIPEAIDGEELDRGEEITLEYTDWGPSGANFVGEEHQDIRLQVFTSNFGATIELDQKVYTWTDKVFITIVAPDHNFDSSLIDEIGRDATDPLQVSTREGKIDNYRLAETGPDTGIFTGEVILTGFQYLGIEGVTIPEQGPTGNGPTDGLLPASDDDGITVSYEYSEDETVVGSSLIRWNIGEAEWLAASYPASGTGVIRVIDPDMNLNPEAVDNFAITVISDSVASGISLTVTETSKAAGIFEGTVFFTTTDAPTGSRLRVAEGDTITAEYDDTTLPDPHSRGDELTISATALIGTIVPPLERVPVSNLRVVDNFGSTLDTVQVDQQVQVTADLTNGQTRDQAFAYLVQIQDEDNVTVHLAWISGSVAEGQSFSPSVSWTPAASGTYTATTFAWESVSNPEALSPPVSLEITVS
ncbi:MAG: hypothetical protein MPK75_06145 [Alphaproteobacteria bacterium]|nr:hypothetical protein [Alphaproteobacteria bacterium]